ncbi:MAG TPA: division/cell wall cluster transcriptional repressor MraZ [Alphaproteobacteria bacterium]|nr:division/cell wall cluster transcriptional repressor MraZ [Alphaproteobacteria bacterium]
MALFLSTYVNRIDKKGRVSVPASFRAALEASGSPILFVTPHHELPAIDGNSQAWMEQLVSRLDELPMFSRERSNLEHTILGKTRDLTLDPEGRISLPKALLDKAGIEDQVAFVGLGRYFQIWRPETLETHRAQAEEATVSGGLTLPKPRGAGA